MLVASTARRPPLGTTSWSFTDTEPSDIKYDVKHTHVVTIGNINKKMEAEHGTVLQSKEFCIKIGDAITDWYIDIYPNGHDYDGSLKHIGIYLVRDTDTKFYSDANFILSLIDSNGSKRYSASYSLTLPESEAKANNFHGMAYGFPLFISHTELRDDRDLIPDDTLTIMCELTINGGGVSLVDSGPSSILVPAGNEETGTWNYMGDMREVFKDGKFTDAFIVCQEKELTAVFPCHKAILAGRSQVFEAMFSPNFKEGMENKVEVVDVAADVLEEMLRFIYCGGVKNLKDGAANILVAAEKYALVDLKQMCEESLCVHMTVENVLDMMDLSDLHNAANLRATALKFIVENAKEVSAQKEWRERIPGVMVDIIDAIIQKGH